MLPGAAHPLFLKFVYVCIFVVLKTLLEQEVQRTRRLESQAKETSKLG